MRFCTISQSASQVTLCPAPPQDVTFDKQKLQNHILPPWRRSTVNKNPSPSQVSIRMSCSCVASFFYLFIFKHSFICDISGSVLQPIYPQQVCINSFMQKTVLWDALLSF